MLHCVKMNKEQQEKYKLWYLRLLHYRHKWARWLSKEEIIKWCKARWYNKNTQDVVLSLHQWYLIDNPKIK